MTTPSKPQVRTPPDGPTFVDDGCECEWPDSCGGLGMLECDGCGGDFCVCLCGGEWECPGCADCDERDDCEAAP